MNGGGIDPIQRQNEKIWNQLSMHSRYSSILLRYVQKCSHEVHEVVSDSLRCSSGLDRMLQCYKMMVSKTSRD